jgi:hypothetical protein
VDCKKTVWGRFVHDSSERTSKLHLVGVQGVRREYKFFYEKENKIHELGTVFLHINVISAVKMVEFVSDTCHTIILRGRWRYVIILSFYEKLECEFDTFLKYLIKTLLESFNAKVEKENI